MKTKFFLLLILAGLTPLFFACSDDDDDSKSGSGTESDNAYVNKWMYEKMDEWYLWRDKMPAKTSLNFESDPETFFSSMLYSNESSKGYTFSTIETSHSDLLKSASFSLESAVSTASLGFEYITVYIQKTGNYENLVTYVYPNTNAALKGLRRGDIITKVNGIQVDEDNYWKLLSASNTNNLTVYSSVENKTFSVSIDPTPAYEENPILIDTVYTNYTGHRIGYLAYNSFTPKDLVSKEYDVQLIKKLSDFQSKGVTDVILDLRYNGGGYVSSAQALASALVPELNTSYVMDIMEYNDVKQKQMNKRDLSDNFIKEVTNSSNKVLATIPNLGKQLSNLYIIGTQYTASASELIINVLKPYYEENFKTLKVVGERTLGKNVGSFAIYEDDDKRNTYVIWPISFTIYNKNKESDYAQGFKPDIEADDIKYWRTLGVGLYNLGDTREILLNTAIAAITGQNSSLGLRSTTSVDYKIVGSSNDKKPLNKTLIRLEN